MVCAGNKRNTLRFGVAHGHSHKRQTNFSPKRVHECVKVLCQVSAHKRKREQIKRLHNCQKASVRRHGEPWPVHGVNHVYKHCPGRQISHRAHIVAFLPKRGALQLCATRVKSMTNCHLEHNRGHKRIARIVATPAADQCTKLLWKVFGQVGHGRKHKIPNHIFHSLSVLYA